VEEKNYPPADDWDYNETKKNNLLPVVIHEIELNDLESLKIRNGQFVSRFITADSSCLNNDLGSLVKIINRNQVIGLGNYSNKILKPVIVFSY
jgi:hypothetical protein